ncbi:CocE/NonD family hydrolase [Candidatus Corynebacterium faecigallinarum]|uniref:CocE/NonD family hydrolase n=1 Tax=Candidatus Corynebacterium faecigallinarum TaxID=2838528 RepID=UPI003FD4B49B
MITDPRPRQHVAETPDGVMLRGDLWEAPVPSGIVIVRTPYDARQHAALARSWVERGFHCLLQDVRGRYRSDGNWNPYQHEGDDGADVVAQLRRTYPNLPILAFGASYAAHAALEAARGVIRRGGTGLTAVITLVPALGLAETAWDSKGRAQLGHRIGWWHEHGQGRIAQAPLPPDELVRRTAQAEAMGPVLAARCWGWSTHTLEQWERLWQADRLDLTAHYSLVLSPLLVITGDNDFFDADAHRLASSWPASRHLVTGPWGHRLASDITDPRLREQLRTTGGIGGIIDDWLNSLDLTETIPGSACISTSLTASRFDPADGMWHHERNAA